MNRTTPPTSTPPTSTAPVRAARPARRARALTALAALAATSALVLSGCSDPVPAASPAPTSEATATPEPALTVENATAVLGKVDDVLEVADKKRSSDALRSRLSGPALAMRGAELDVARDTKSDDGVTVLPMKAQTLVLPTTTTWPRAFGLVSEQPSSTEPPLLMGLRQTGARDGYTLWGWARLFPGTEMPAVAKPETGTAELARDDDSLVMTPETVATRYLDVLSRGSSSKYAKSFGTDPFRKALEANASALRSSSAFKEAKGKFTRTASLEKKSPVLSWRTADGGAIVMADASIVERTAVEKGGTITAPNDTLRSLLGDTTLKNELVVTYRDVVAFSVPPKGATGDGATVHVLGVEHVPVKVTD